ncbi:hypothetical protein PSN45_000861 [Yamadazyma tenuis]|uniref:Quinate transporter n=1 Tax=Candida tenuis (strain ATCC 10573 / BCRC 21748 / CBS 615 / JCM 9827 / NBRC 10315 / NRRL Y-1498 / VKM Y-70) TaxID=590646 RepID=G3BB48_CANTC|nr:general substrate transporter [Yamadazyma tenuis ATCC 10573]EGV62138.1 general substrate transporter [Yamadazyma tenuis ATCC 10573]WEJ93398.1 hypothetical protein PSN45_000861 [Yamadazyma tenuis]
MWLLSKFAHKDDSAHPAPIETYNSRLLLLALAASTGSAMYGYDTGFIGGAISLPSFTARYGLDSVTGTQLAALKANIVSTFQAGCFFGAIIAYSVNEKFGRRKTMLAFAIVFVIGVTFQIASSGKIGLIYAGRAITGLSVGTMSMIVPVYNAEWSPPAVRGLTVGLYECVYQTSSLLAFWVNYAVKIHQPDTSERQWQIPFALQYIFGGAVILCMWFQPESYRWLIKAGRVDDARDALVRIRKLPAEHPYINYEIQSVLIQLNEEAQIAKKDVLRETGNFIQRNEIYIKLKEVTKSGMRYRLFVGVSVMVWQNLSGINALNYYSPTIFKSIGVSGNNVDLLATGIFGVAKTVTNIIAVLFMVDYFGRRGPLLFGSSLTFVFMMYLGIYSQLSGSFDHVVEKDGGSRAALACVYMFAVFYAFSWNCMPFIVCSEIFPMAIRNFCMTICVMAQWLMQFVIVYSNPYMMTNIKYGSFYFFGACLLLSVPFVYFIIPETRGISLENMDVLFSIRGTALKKRKKADEIIAMRKQEVIMDESGKVAVAEVEDVDGGSIEKVPTSSTRSIQEV